MSFNKSKAFDLIYFKMYRFLSFIIPILISTAVLFLFSSIVLECAIKGSIEKTNEIGIFIRRFDYKCYEPIVLLNVNVTDDSLIKCIDSNNITGSIGEKIYCQNGKRCVKHHTGESNKSSLYHSLENELGSLTIDTCSIIEYKRGFRVEYGFLDTLFVTRQCFSKGTCISDTLNEIEKINDIWYLPGTKIYSRNGNIFHISRENRKIILLNLIERIPMLFR
jgi:hypothetical protein